MTTNQTLGLLREQAYFSGGWNNADDGGTIDVFNPATGERIGTVPDLGVAETKRAIAHAHRALPDWRRTLPQERADILRNWYQLIIDHTDQLAILMTTEQGKPLAEAVGEIEYAASFVRWFAEEAQRLYGETIPSHLPNRKLIVQREPIGVVATVTPWNFPAGMLTRKAAAALAAGCTVVAYPSRETPYSALALAALAEQAGLPTGAFSVVTGQSRTIVTELCAAQEVRALSFTGSTEVGRLLLAQCAPTVKKTCMELGGHAPFIAFSDIDIDEVVAAAVDAKYQTSGQDCLAANRIFIHAEIYDEFLIRFSQAVARLKVGAGFDEGVDVGPLINESAVNKCADHVQDAIDQGARLMVGGHRHSLGNHYFEPTVLADVTNDMKISKEETFGPVAAVIPFTDESQVISTANDTEYGLVAYVYTNDIRRAWRLSDALEYGMVAVNSVKITGAPIPFGGIKQSGLGREGARQGIEEFTELKYVCMST